MGRRFWLAAVMVILATLSTPEGTSEAGPTTDFVLETYASGLPLITDLEWGPNGLLYVAHQNGTVSVVSGGVATSTFVDISTEVNNAGERGLLGIAVHPELLTGSPFVYLLYTYDPPETVGETGDAGPDGSGQRVARLTRFTADASTAYTTAVPGSAVTILGGGGTWATLGDPADTSGAGNPDWACGNPAVVDDCLPADAVNHTIGTVRFGVDGMLYVGNGDASSFAAEDRSLRALDVNSMAGKVLRIHPDTGLGLPDNPYWTGDPNNNASRVLYLGLRNPYRFSFGPTGDLWIGDVGAGGWEELNKGVSGADFGWPCYEGGDDGVLVANPDFSSFPTCQLYYTGNSAVAPAFAYSHESGSAAIIAGEVVTNSGWPGEYQGTFMVADYVRFEINAVDIDGVPITSSPFATDVLAVDLTFGPDGHLYFADISQSEVGRIRYAPGELAPGLLRVTSSPPVPTMISANGVDRSQWGLDWLMVDPGVYDVCFSDVPGWVTPSCEEVVVVSGATATAQANFVRMGTVVVGTAGPGGSPVPSVISLDGVAVDDGGVSTQRGPGDIEICWGPVPDLQPPPCQTVSLLSATTSVVEGVFISAPGAPGPGAAGQLRVTTSPSVPSTVLLDGSAVTQWSTEWVPTAPGSYQLCFTAVPGFISPPCQTIQVSPGVTTAAVGVFTPMGVIRATTLPPTDVAISVDGVPSNNWGLFTNIAPVTYEVCAAFVIPVCQTAVVSAGTETAVELRPGTPNLPPIADAGPDQMLVDSNGDGFEIVDLTGAASLDADGSIVSYEWREGPTLIATGVSPPVSLGVGVHIVDLTVTDNDGATATDTTTITIDPAPAPADVLYLGASGSGSVGGVAYGVEDIIQLDRLIGSWAMFFDGSDVGVSQDVSAFHILDDGSLILAYSTEVEVPGLGGVDPYDLVRFVPTSTGPTTAGSFEAYFQGSDVDLRDTGEEIDALSVLPDGDLLMSVSGEGEVDGVGAFEDEDVVRFSPTELGTGTDGTWTMFFDGSDVALATATEDLTGMTLDASGDIYLTTLGSFVVPGVSGVASDVFVCSMPAAGPVTACSFASYWSGDIDGYTGTIDSLYISFG